MQILLESNVTTVMPLNAVPAQIMMLLWWETIPERIRNVLSRNDNLISPESTCPIERSSPVRRGIYVFFPGHRLDVLKWYNVNSYPTQRVSDSDNTLRGLEIRIREPRPRHHTCNQLPTDVRTDVQTGRYRYSESFFRGHLYTVKPVFRGHLTTVKPVFIQETHQYSKICLQGTP